MKDEKINECGCCCGSEEEIEKDTCSCGCGEEHEEHEEHCDCGCGEEHEEHCDCGCGEEDECLDTILVDLVDEEGNNVTCQVIEEFEYKENVYALVQNPENKSVYLFREEDEEGEDGDEVELVNLEEKEFEEVTAYYENLE